MQNKINLLYINETKTIVEAIKKLNKSGAKFMKTYIVDGEKRAWEVPMILFKENKAAEAIIDKGLPIYKRGGVVKK